MYKYILALGFLMLLSCSQGKAQHNTEQIDASILSINPFSEYPPELDGCLCTSFSDSADKTTFYILIGADSLMNSVAFLKVGNELLKLNFINSDKEKGSFDPVFTEEYQNKDYTLSILYKFQKETCYECLFYTTQITITRKSDKKILDKQFLTECSC